MGKRAIYIGRQFMLWVIALQILNLSFGSAFAWDNGYDYAYSYNKSYDPTETAVEWIVELKYGQQQAFSYDSHQDDGKCLIKTFHWKTDLQRFLAEAAPLPVSSSRRAERPAAVPASPVAELVSPPPRPTPVPPVPGGRPTAAI
jgi:hypothetical protein